MIVSDVQDLMDIEILKTLYISSRRLLINNPHLVRVCNYGYNAFVRENKLILFSTFRPTNRNIDLRKECNKIVE